MFDSKETIICEINTRTHIVHLLLVNSYTCEKSVLHTHTRLINNKTKQNESPHGDQRSTLIPFIMTQHTHLDTIRFGHLSSHTF